MLKELTLFVKQAFRTHLRRPVFSILVILTLALGVGATASIFSVVHALLLRPMPFEDPERLVMLTSAQPEREAHRLAVSYPDFLEWRRLSEVFSQMAAVSGSRPVSLTGGDEPRHLGIELVSGNYFEILGVEAELGRVFTAEDDRIPGGHPVAVLSHPLWQNHFEADPDIVGRQILLNDHSFTVIGVLPKFYRGTWWDPIDLWTPIMMAEMLVGPEYLQKRDLHWHTVMARMQPGISLDEAGAAINRLAEDLEAAYPVSNEGYRVDLYPLRELYYDYIEADLWKALGAAVFLLLLCCVNIASLLLTRGRDRQRDLAVRSALGASRGRLLLEQTGENLLLAVIGGGLGLLLAGSVTAWLVRQSTIPTMNFDEYYMGWPVIAAVFGAVLVCGLLFSLGPAVQTLWTDLWKFLRQGSQPAGRGRFRSMLDALVVAELGLALVLLVGAGLSVQRFFELRDADLGFPADGLLTLRLGLTSSRYEADEALKRFADRLVGDVEALPGVTGAALTGPFAPPDARLYTDSVFEDRLAAGAEDAGLRLYRQYVTPGYFRVMGIELVEGREFTPRDTTGSPPVAVVAQAVSERIWPEGSGIGRRMRRGLPDSTEFPWREIVGIAETVKNRGPKDFGRGPDFDLYLPFHQEPQASPTLMVRFRDGVTPAASAVREVVRSLDPNVPVYAVQTLREHLAWLASDERFTGLLMVIFAAFAVIVTAIGLFGVLSYGVRRRTREIGLRVALGASRRQVLTMVARQGLGQLLAGLVLGGLLLYLLQAWDLLPTTEDARYGPAIALSLLCLLGISSLAVFFPARRAARVVPTEALRDD